MRSPPPATPPPEDKKEDEGEQAEKRSTHSSPSKIVNEEAKEGEEPPLEQKDVRRSFQSHEPPEGEDLRAKDDAA